MKTLHLAGTILGVVGCSILMMSACSSSGTKRKTGTGGSGNTGNVGVGGNNVGGGNVGGVGNNNAGGTGNTTWVVPDQCASSAVVDSTNTLIADFECLPGDAGQKFDWFPWPTWDAWQHGAYWYYNGANAYDPSWQTWNCVPTARGGLIQPGHNSENAGYVEAYVPQTSWGAGFGIWMGGSATSPDTDQVVSCIDVSAFTGISFWIKGQNQGSGTTTGGGPDAYQVQLQTFDTQSGYPETIRTCALDGDGDNVCTGSKAGSCTGTSCKPYIYNGTLPGATADWTQVTLAWTDFAMDPEGDVTAPFNPARLTGINISFPTNDYGGTVAFYIDDIEFTGGGATELPRTCPSPAGGATGAGGAPDFTTWQTAGAGGDLAALGLPTCDGTPSAGGAGN